MVTRRTKLKRSVLYVTEQLWNCHKRETSNTRLLQRLKEQLEIERMRIVYADQKKDQKMRMKVRRSGSYDCVSDGLSGKKYHRKT